MYAPEPARPDAVCREARDAGATHVLPVSDRLVLFYRRTAAGAIEFASAHREESVWTLTTWAPRLTHTMPPAARPIGGAL